MDTSARDDEDAGARPGPSGDGGAEIGRDGGSEAGRGAAADAGGAAGDGGDAGGDDGGTGESVRIRVNGEDRSVPPDLTIADLLERLEVDGRRVAVEHNRRVVPRDERGETALDDGDEVEVVQFVGGGR